MEDLFAIDFENFNLARVGVDFIESKNSKVSYIGLQHLIPDGQVQSPKYVLYHHTRLIPRITIKHTLVKK